MVPILLLASCSDSNLARDGGADGFVPILQLDPMIADFGAIAETETAIRTITATNIGDASLTIESFTIDGSAAFTLLTELPDSLGPNESATVDIAFTPTSQKLTADLIVTSNAVASPVVTTNLRGEGLYPALRVSPKPYDMGSVPPGCERDGQVELVNVGTTTLTIESAILVGSGFTTPEPPAFPFSLEPDESTALGIQFTSTDFADHEAMLYVSSNDPAGVTIAGVSAYVEEPPDEAEDHLVQGTGPWDKTDVLVYVDQSGSMDDDQARLASNFSTFIYNLEATLTDWQLIVANDDDGCRNTDILSPYVADAATQFSTGVTRGGGNWTEAGLTVANNALEETFGGCNAGFVRDDSKTMVLLVSDEPEQSRQGWSTVTAQILDSAPTATIVAIVGPAPNGCSTANLGSGYIEAATLTGGDVFSICESDWTEYFAEIVAIATEPPVDRLPLSWVPSLTTLEVTLDGDVWTEWTYNAADNSVLFNANAIPEGGQRVEATYLVAVDGCP
ncbi:hypothetical protein LBMAG42_10850 [Deltaproteobacteria bacterium]|nr:hypothetical protein LBMAG42_10850 [Deltaproteobacteria bacterium]